MKAPGSESVIIKKEHKFYGDLERDFVFGFMVDFKIGIPWERRGKLWTERKWDSQMQYLKIYGQRNVPNLWHSVRLR